MTGAAVCHQTIRLVLCMHRALSFANKLGTRQVLDPPAQCLFLRLHPRRGPWFRLGGLAYAEVADAVRGRQGAGRRWACGAPGACGRGRCANPSPDPTPHERACRPLAGPGGGCAICVMQDVGKPILACYLTWRETCFCCGPESAQAADCQAIAPTVACGMLLYLCALSQTSCRKSWVAQPLMPFLCRIYQHPA